MMDDARLAVRVIEPDEGARRLQRLMTETDEHTSDVLERCGGLHPVTFGHCGYPGLCVRGTARAFCTGCPFLVRRPEYVDRVDFFLEGYVQAADASAWATWRVPANDTGCLPTSSNCGLYQPPELEMNEPEVNADPFAHLKQQANERSDRTVTRTSAGIAALRADGQQITAESLKQATHELEPGFAALSFQVIRRNPRAYALLAMPPTLSLRRP